MIRAEDVESCAHQSYDLTKLDGIRQFQVDHLDPILQELEQMALRKKEGVVPIIEEERHRFISLNRERRQLSKIINTLKEAYYSHLEKD